MCWDLQHQPTAQGTKIEFFILVQDSWLTLAESHNIDPSGAPCPALGLLAALGTDSRKEHLCWAAAAPCWAGLGLTSPCPHRQAGGVPRLTVPRVHVYTKRHNSNFLFSTCFLGRCVIKASEWLEFCLICKLCHDGRQVERG